MAIDTSGPEQNERRRSNVLTDAYPALAAEWHPTLNGDRVPSIVTSGAKLKAHWQCHICSHVWQARVSSRARGHGCPACARRETGHLKSQPAPGDSLAERFPGIAAEWHPNRNDDLSPATVGYASNKKVWWLCARCGHEWQIQVSNRTSGSSCRRCAHAAMRKPKPGASLAERNPAVAAEWHPTLNGDLTPHDVAFSAKRKAWWKCGSCGNEWDAAIGNRAVGAGCPGCRTRGQGRGLPRLPKGSVTEHNSALTTQTVESNNHPTAHSSSSAAPDVPPGTSLSERYPEVAAQWHPDRNGDRTPTDFRWASNARAWWLCPACGHSWSAIIISRTRGDAGCPPCSRRRAGAALATPKAGQSLAERRPDLAAQWHPTRNGDLIPAMVTAKSGKRAWWLCSEGGHEWEAQIGSRAAGSGCKACATQQLAVTSAKPRRGRSLAEQDAELASQWHPTRNHDLTPADVTGNSGKKVWWQCVRGHEWQAMINNRTKARGCPKCIFWGTSVEEIRLRHELLAVGVPIEVEHAAIPSPEGRPLSCDMVVPAWNIVIEFDGNRFHQTPEGHEKDRRKTAALKSEGWTVIRVREDLEPISTHDVVVAKFSSEVDRAKAVVARLNQIGHRVQHHDHYLATETSWASTLADDEIRRPRARSLAAELPSLAAEWDPDKNAPLTPEHVTFGSGQKAWWLCPVCDNSWHAVIGSRANGSGCPKCGREASLRARTRPKPGQSLADLHPDVAAEWHPDLNGQLTPNAVTRASSKNVWWLCPACALEYQMVVSKRTVRGSRCPRCCGD
ncbi:MAG: zinc-ribbon domain-containing protein [Mycobacterium sp.]